MTQPKEFIDPIRPQHVCKLRKALYGLKQATWAWFDKLRSALLSWGLKNSKSNASLFVYKFDKTLVLLLVYADDILITRNNPKMLRSLQKNLNKIFPLKLLGSLQYFFLV